MNDIRNAYYRATGEYAKRFLDELAHKPRDLELLQRFASAVGPGRQVLDLGCGPGHTTAHLASLGVRPTGVDLSPEMIRKAWSLFPGTSFRTGDLLHLAYQNESVAGALAFYCIVHLQASQLVIAFREMLRVLEPGGVLLLAFHIGTDTVDSENFLDTGVRLEFFPFAVADVQSALLAAGFEDLEIIERPPYESEYPTNRCYLFACKPRIGKTGSKQ